MIVSHEQLDSINARLAALDYLAQFYACDNVRRRTYKQIDMIRATLNEVKQADGWLPYRDMPFAKRGER